VKYLSNSNLFINDIFCSVLILFKKLDFFRFPINEKFFFIFPESSNSQLIRAFLSFTSFSVLFLNKLAILFLFPFFLLSVIFILLLFSFLLVIFKNPFILLYSIIFSSSLNLFFSNRKKSLFLFSFLINIYN
jgi:hypothetical protein